MENWFIKSILILLLMNKRLNREIREREKGKSNWRKRKSNKKKAIIKDLII